MINNESIYEWKCTVCNEIIKGSKAPEKCPVCGVGSEYFIKLEKNDISFSSTEYKSFIVIGASAAGMTAVEEIRKRNNVCEITVISKEPI